MAIRLKMAGEHNFVIFDKADGVGGTWWHNTYPGAACDVRAHAYSFSFELNPTFERPFPDQPEILAYLERCAVKYELEPHLRLSTQIDGLTWNDGTATWTIHSSDGATHEASVVVGATGMFNQQNHPQIDGLDDFCGTMFHSARWDHEHDLAGERVAVIGSAASATQFVPRIAPDVGQLHLFQRTANWVMPKPNDPYDQEKLDEWARDADSLWAFRTQLWNDLEGQVRFPEDQARRAESYGLRQLDVVEDPEVRAKLTPTHPYGCKRPLIANDFYPTFNRPNVELVTDGIDRVTPSGIRTVDGAERACDTIILATGFQTTKYLAAMDVVGRAGRRLDQEWTDGATAYLGITTHGFPNLFMLYGPNTNPSAGSIIFVIEAQVDYVLQHLEYMANDGVSAVEPTAEAQAGYNLGLHEMLDSIAPWQGGCGNYYRPPGGGKIVTQSPWSMAEYLAYTEADDRNAYLRR